MHRKNLVEGVEIFESWLPFTEILKALIYVEWLILYIWSTVHQLYSVTPVVIFRVKNCPGSIFTGFTDAKLVSSVRNSKPTFSLLLIVRSILDLLPIPRIGCAEWIRGIRHKSLNLENFWIFFLEILKTLLKYVKKFILNFWSAMQQGLFNVYQFLYHVTHICYLLSKILSWFNFLLIF